MKNVDALFILCWRTTANQYSFYLSTCTPKHETLKNCSTSFFIKSCDLFLFLFSQFFYQFYIHMYMKPLVHSLTHTPAVKKKEQSRSLSTELAMPGVLPTRASQMSIRYYCYCTCTASQLQHSLAALLSQHTTPQIGARG